MLISFGLVDTIIVFIRTKIKDISEKKHCILLTNDD